MELRFVINLLRRWWWFVLLGIILAAAISFGVSSQLQPQYRTSTRLFINQTQGQAAANGAVYQDLITSERLAKTYAEVLRSRPLLDETARQLGLEQILPPTVTTVRDTALLQITVTDTDPARAAVIANKIAAVFIQRLQQDRAGATATVRQQVDTQVAEARQRLDETNGRLTQLKTIANPDAETTAQIGRTQLELTQYQDTYGRLFATQQQMAFAEAQSASAVSVVEPARVPTIRISPNIRQNVLLAAFLGLALTGGLAFLYERLDDRLRDAEEVRRRFNIPPLAVIGRMKGDTPPLLSDLPRGKHDEFTEAMRLLRTNLDFVTMGGPVIVCLSSAIPQEGKSTISSNLALVQAQAGKRVILIDADLRNPGIDRVFKIPREKGLSTYLAQTPGNHEPTFQDGPLGVRIMTAGPVPPNPSELLNSPRMEELLAKLRGEADLIIVDSAPLLPIADTLVLQRLVDHLVLVVDVRRTGTRTLGRLLTMLEQASAKVAGIVLNKDTNHIDQYGYGYGYGYGAAYGKRYGYGVPSEKAGD